MIRTPTVFVVGAGASCELGFPSGSKLLELLGATLDIRFGDWERQSGDPRVFAALEELRTQSGSTIGINEYLRSCWRIRDAAALGLSIDNVLNQLDNDPLVSPCGKIAIAQQLLSAEKNSSIRVDPEDPSDFPLSQVRSTWLGRFAQLLCQDMRASELSEIFDQVTIISFNYDRSIRRFMPYGLMSQFGISLEEAQALTRNLKVIHPYGSLGQLPWEANYGTYIPS